MNLQTFTDSLSGSAPPAGLSPALQALWREAQGDWDGAHRLLQGESDSDQDWVHAYLHRKEGDLANAGYWYRRAGKSLPDQSLVAEWEAIVAALLAG
jgi:hypothetical protein